MRISFYILVISVGFIFADSLSLEIDASNAKTYEDSYEKAIDFRIDGDYNKSLSILLQIEAFHIKSTYVIAEIYLNEVKNPNIALDYYRQVVGRTLSWREADKDLSFSSSISSAAFSTRDTISPIPKILLAILSG